MIESVPGKPTNFNPLSAWRPLKCYMYLNKPAATSCMFA